MDSNNSDERMKSTRYDDERKRKKVGRREASGKHR